MEEKLENLDNRMRIIIREELDKKFDLENEKKMRREVERLYYLSWAKCISRGIHPPEPPSWLKDHIPWEPDKIDRNYEFKIAAIALTVTVLCVFFGVLLLYWVKKHVG